MGIHFVFAVCFTTTFNAIDKTTDQSAVIHAEYPTIRFHLQQLFNACHGVSFLFGQTSKAFIFTKLDQRFRSCLRNAHDVNPPASQLSRQACVLTFTTDCQAELIFRHNYGGSLVFVNCRVQVNTRDPGRTDGFADVNSCVRTPFDHIDLLIVEFSYDRLDANTTLTNTGTNRVNSLLGRRNSNLGTLTRLAGD